MVLLRRWAVLLQAFQKDCMSHMGILRMDRGALRARNPCVIIRRDMASRALVYCKWCPKVWSERKLHE